MESPRLTGDLTPRVSVVVCTRHRPAFLEACLSHLLAQTVDPATYQVLVVDNGTDDPRARRVVESFASRGVRYIPEPQVGLSRARNRGWRAARAEIVAFIDDDAEAEPQWIERMLAVMQTMTPAPACIGGRIIPIWDLPRPAWLDDSLMDSLSIVDWSQTPRALTPGEWIPGCNMVFRRACLETLGGFSETLGRRGGKLLGMEETLLHAQLRRRGEMLYYDPQMAVRHHIDADRLEPRWFVSHAFWNGVSFARLQQSETRLSLRQRAGRARRIWREQNLPQALLKYGRDFTALTDVHPRCVAIGWSGYCLAMLGLVR